MKTKKNSIWAVFYFQNPRYRIDRMHIDSDADYCN